MAIKASYNRAQWRHRKGYPVHGTPWTCGHACLFCNPGRYAKFERRRTLQTVREDARLMEDE